MKLGLAMAILAVSLFSGTVIWSAAKTIERAVYSLEKLGLSSDTPERRSDKRFFYAADRPFPIVNISVPVSVELDEGFTGVELLGDTSLFYGLRVSTQYGFLNVSRQPTRKTAGKDGSREQLVYDDSLFQKIKAAGIAVRIGIGAGAGLPTRHFEFKGCKYITCATPLQGRRVRLNLFRVDSAQFNLRMKAIELMQTAEAGSSLQLSGAVDQVYFRQLTEGKVDARQLYAREVYVRGAHKTDLELHASEIANLQGLDSCKVRLSGNPAYTKTKEAEPPRGRW